MLEAPLPPAESGKDMLPLSKHTYMHILNTNVNKCDKCEMFGVFFNEEIERRKI